MSETSRPQPEARLFSNPHILYLYITLYQPTRRQIPEDSNVHNRCYEKFKFRTVLLQTAVQTAWATVTLSDELIDMKEIGFEHQRFVLELRVKRKAVETGG